MSAAPAKQLFAVASAVAIAYVVYVAASNNKKAQEPKSLFERLGGDAAVEAAVDKFYTKVLADERINKFFVHTNMTVQRRKQVSFMAMAFGKPNMKYAGLSMDNAHRKLVKQGMNDSHFDAVAEDLALTLIEMGVAQELVDQVISAVGGLREQVMCRGPWAIKE